MQKFFKYLLLFLCFTSCSYKNTSIFESEKDSITIVSWNVQTFFDAQKDGTEYAEFKKSDWTEQKYITRLERLCNFITTVDADIYVFEEIENEKVMYDISNYLAAGAFKKNQFWTYTCFYKPENSAIGCGVFSRFPISDFKTCSLDIRTQSLHQPFMRNLLSMQIHTNTNSFNLFVNHWKSKSGGEEESNIWRQLQESQLCNALLQNNLPAVICGDFNRDIDEFIQNFDGRISKSGDFGKILLSGASSTGRQTSEVYTPWYNSKGKSLYSTGTYYYNNSWEKIDNFFVQGNIKITGFMPIDKEPYINEYGSPAGFKLHSGNGYSDHLPIIMQFIVF